MKGVKGDKKKLKQVVDAQKINNKALIKDPQQVARALTEKVIFGDHSQQLRQLSIAEMKKLKSDTLLEEFRRLTSVACDIHYCGNLDNNKVVEIVKSNFNLNGVNTASNTPYYRPNKAVEKNAVYFINEPNASQSVVVAYVPGEINSDDKSRNTSALFNNYFGSGMSSILFQEIREFRSLAYGVSGNYKLSPNKDRDKQGLLYIALSTQEDKTTDAIKLVDSLLHNMPLRPDKIKVCRQDLINSANNDFPTFREISPKIAELRQKGEMVDPNIQLIKSLPDINMYSSTSYFLYRGQEMGFQYELGEQFAKSLGVKLRVEVARNARELIGMEQVLLVGPTEPATKRGLSGFCAVNSSATFRANRAAARFISRIYSCT